MNSRRINLKKGFGVFLVAVLLCTFLCAANVYAQDKDVPYSGLVKRFDYGVESHSYATFYNGVDYSKVYDFNFYLNRYPDVQAAYGKDDIAVLSHFVNTGMNEGRQACKTFDVQSYYNANQDLRMKFGLNLSQYYLHYIKQGKKEKRICLGVSKLKNPVSSYWGLDLKEIYDGNYYMTQNPDVCSFYTTKNEYVTLVDDSAILSHFVNAGIKEGRKGNNSDFWNNRQDYNWTSVENIIQYPELPSGCESVALTIALNHYGFNLDKTTIADYFMPSGESYIDSYPGDPYMEDSSGAFPPAVTIAANNFLSTQDTKLKAYNISGSDLSFLYTLIDMGCPVVVWTTLYSEEPIIEDEAETVDGINYYQWYWPEHCAVLYGYDKANDIVYISDPNEGDVEVNASWFEYIYDFIGRYAVVIK